MLLHSELKMPGWFKVTRGKKEVRQLAAAASPCMIGSAIQRLGHALGQFSPMPTTDSNATRTKKKTTKNAAFDVRAFP